MKRILLTALLIVTANTVAALQLSIQHNKDLPTPYELITKGKMLDKTDLVEGNMAYFIAWDKTDDIYYCVLRGTFNEMLSTWARCRLAVQQSEGKVK